MIGENNEDANKNYVMIYPPDDMSDREQTTKSNGRT